MMSRRVAVRKLLQASADAQGSNTVMLGDEIRDMLDVLARNPSHEEYATVLLLARVSCAGSNPSARGGVALLGADMRRHDQSRRRCHCG